MLMHYEPELCIEARKIRNESDVQFSAHFQKTRNSVERNACVAESFAKLGETTWLSNTLQLGDVLNDGNPTRTISW